MRSILVLAGGSDSDEAVFETALALARPLGAHLEFFHVRIGPGEAAIYTPHVDFARGAALTAAIERLKVGDQARSAVALRHFHQFCVREAIPVAAEAAGPAADEVSAAWCEEQGDAAARMTRCARHSDVAVVGRPSKSNGLPPDVIARLLVESGRPVLIAPAKVRRQLTGTVMVCWKETAEAARALAVALPLLSKAKKVVLVGVEEKKDGALEGLRDLARRLSWNGIKADVKCLPASDLPVADRLEGVAAEIDADIMIMGGYGHGRMRELAFGGCTQRFLDKAERPVLLMH